MKSKEILVMKQKGLQPRNNTRTIPHGKGRFVVRKYDEEYCTPNGSHPYRRTHDQSTTNKGFDIFNGEVQVLDSGREFVARHHKS